MKPDGELIKQVAQLMVSASAELQNLTDPLLVAVVFTDDHQPPEREYQMNEHNLRCQMRRALLVQRVSADLLTQLLRVA